MRYFVGVCEAGSLLKASTRLHVAQPALGQQIAALEAEVGTALFARSSRGMALTEAGCTFLDHARVVLADVERARQAVRLASETPSGEVVIGLPTTTALSATVPIVQACQAQLPRVRLKVIEAYSGFLREWLQAGRLDWAILFGSQAEATLDKRPLLEEGLALITPAGGEPLPATLPLARLADWPLVLPGREHGLRRTIEEACAAQGVALQVVAEIDSLPSVKRAVECGVGSTILPLVSVAEEVAAQRLQAATIDDAGMRRRVVLATSVTRPTTQACAAVMALAIGLIRERVESRVWPGRWIGQDGGV
ncbi:MAG TPA: LysR substrate-binding domain-containing protein [Burkholderiaceae bacterium]|nr:LysR substrate-binding domain-containing protein [Burkholderiaceae bacterium]HNB46468.1 LysR substrate-binding domain-containing protein [Burkholderiaceae bacterium]HNG81925.1 LysR substrate-binding domain-containing protein [Burkholderiaceae bacterium]